MLIRVLEHVCIIQILKDLKISTFHLKKILQVLQKMSLKMITNLRFELEKKC
jgi:hypothetical protein